jgi:hypothetical protein
MTLFNSATMRDRWRAFLFDIFVTLSHLFASSILSQFFGWFHLSSCLANSSVSQKIHANLSCGSFLQGPWWNHDMNLWLHLKRAKWITLTRYKSLEFEWNGYLSLIAHFKPLIVTDQSYVLIGALSFKSRGFPFVRRDLWTFPFSIKNWPAVDEIIEYLENHCLLPQRTWTKSCTGCFIII